MTFNPDVVVEIAFNAGYATAAASRTWTDVSTYVEAQNAISIQRGRQDEFSDVQPSRCTIVLDNRDGRFTPGYTSGAYYPNVLKGRPVRVTATWSAVTYRRFLGYIDEWDVEWPDGSDGKPIVTITASSRSAILGRRTFRSLIEEEVLSDTPVMYYPLGEPEGATSAGNESTTQQNPLVVTQDGSGGTLTFGNGTGPAYDSLTAAVLTRGADANNGLYLRSTLASTVTSDATGYLVFECWFVTSTADGALICLGTGSSKWLSLAVSLSKLVAVRFSGGVANEYITSSASVDDGLLHHAVMTLEPNAGNFRTYLYLDGVQVGTTASTVGAGDLDAVGATGNVLTVGRCLNGDVTDRVYSGTIAHATVYASAFTSARVLSHYTAGSTGFSGDSSDARLVRLATYAGIPTGEESFEAGMSTSLGYEDITGKAASESLLDVVHTENGLLFDAGDGTLTFHARSHRYSTTSGLTLSAATQKVEADFAPKLDDQGVINDATYTGTSGVVARSIDATSVAAIGTYSDSAELLTTSDLEVQDRANFVTFVYGDPITRVPAASVLLTVQSSGDITSLLGLELGTQITISGLPSQAPASSMDFFIEGIAESIAFENYLMTFTLSPALAALDFWDLGTTGFTELGTTTILGY